MYHLTWKFQTYISKMSFDDKDLANEMWQILRKTPGVTDLKPYKDEPKPATTIKKYPVVRIRFTPGGKTYTYLTKIPCKPGDMVIVHTTDGREIVDVVEYGEMTKEELAKICPLERFQYIRGKVIAA